ncbi:MAG TPA: Vms1/Ankzf1 family peptidyl-tRNA hydrolase, partial [Candidatus Limnocylindrales bacterium]|nr:Vms1/Ankzf1 family peptidyl-tRNA hydrolase [Candidatus Limnocylindrales bacterium]
SGTSRAPQASMTATTTTTKLGPDQAFLRNLLRRLAELESTDAPILSLYIDTRPEAHGERPGERNELTIVRDRLNELADRLELRSDAAASFEADRRRIEELLDTEEINETDGVAIFACSHIGLWEAIGAQTEFDTQITAGPTAELFQLARLLDDQVSAVIAVVDTSTCRLFVTRRGGLAEREGLDEPTAEHTRHDQGGWSQARFQRHIDMQDKRFAKEIAEAIERLVRREKPQHVLLAGDERVISVLDPELPQSVRPLVEHVARIDMRATSEDVRDEIRPMLGALEEADGQDAVQRALAGHRAHDLGVAGVNAVMAALEAGQVDELVIDETIEGDEELRAELIRQAARTDAHVEIVRDHPELRRHDGVAATLRYRI